MGDWVLLRHDMPDGSWHLDWLIEREAGAIGAQKDGHWKRWAGTDAHHPDSRVLLSLRVEGGRRRWASVRSASRGDGRGAGRRLPDHRRMYLNFEGVLPVGRTARHEGASPVSRPGQGGSRSTSRAG